jgi:hypothetical protein
LLQLAQLFDVAIQFREPGAFVAALNVGRGALFWRRRFHAALRQRQAVGRRRSGGLAIVDLRLDLTACLPARRAGIRCRGGAGSQTLAVGAEVVALRKDDFTRFGLRKAADLLGTGHLQHGAGPKPIHVVAHEGLRVAAVQGDEHLVERDPRPLQAASDPAQRVAIAHPIFVAALGRCG